MTTYEYKVYDRNKTNGQLEVWLNDHAAEGWRLVPVNAGMSATMLIMEREKEVANEG